MGGLTLCVEKIPAPRPFDDHMNIGAQQKRRRERIRRVMGMKQDAKKMWRIRSCSDARFMLS